MEFEQYRVLQRFLPDIDPETPVIAYGNGHINTTFDVQTEPRCILQRINTDVFPRADWVMENICAVTRHLQDKIAQAGGDPKRETLTVIPTTDGHSYVQDESGNCFRVYLFIDAVSYDIPKSSEQMRKAAAAFGRFQKMLADFPADTLHEVIADFHNTPARCDQLRDAIRRDAAGRASSVREEIAFAQSYFDRVSVVAQGLRDGSIPLRVTINDTKFNNVLFDPETDDFVAVIDLDTVMPGSVLYDFGDALRCGASTAAEDECDLSKVKFDVDVYRAFAQGYLEEMNGALTQKERELLPFSALLLTFECGIRFLADYLNGDTYFKTHYAQHNLDRARNQFALVRDIEAKLELLQKITAEL